MWPCANDKEFSANKINKASTDERITVSSFDRGQNAIPRRRFLVLPLTSARSWLPGDRRCRLALKEGLMPAMGTHLRLFLKPPCRLLSAQLATGTDRITFAQHELEKSKMLVCPCHMEPRGILNVGCCYIDRAIRTLRESVRPAQAGIRQQLAYASIGEVEDFDGVVGD
jgi:hypothetical protein